MNIRRDLASDLSSVGTLIACMIGLCVVAILSDTRYARLRSTWSLLEHRRVRTALLVLTLLLLPVMLTACGGAGKSGY